MQTDTTDVAVLVASCDAYADVWPPFFALFRRYWPDCPYHVYVGSNEQKPPDADVTHLAIGPDLGWAEGFREMLSRIREPLVLVMLEDYFLTAPTDTRRVGRLVRRMRTLDAACMRLVPVPGAPAPHPEFPEAGELPRGTPYRVSLQAAVWDKATLLELVTPGESPWRLELDGSARSDALPQPFLAVVDGAPGPLRYLATAVVKGVWIREAVALCRRERVPLDTSRRPVETRRAWLARRAAPLRRRMREIRGRPGRWRRALA